MPRSITIPDVDDATATWLTDPTQRAFVVQLHAETGMAQGEGRGRAEHIVSGQVTYFQAVEELAQFMVHVLTSTTKHSQASDDPNDP